MKKIVFLTLILLPFITTAQNITGKAYYQSKTSFDIDKMTGQDMDETTKKMIIEKLKKSKEKNYILTFNNNESIYKEEEKLETGKPNSMIIVGFSSSNFIYKNLKNKILREQKELFSKTFLITDSLPVFNWKLEKESKQIGQYTVYKATTTKKLSLPISSENDSVPTQKTIIITAWYTPQIPVSNGPGKYGGLPGLILELNVQRTTFLCSKIILNPKETEKIIPPSKGKKVSKSEYDSIVSKKMEEMQNNFINGKSSGFKIGG